MHLNLPRNRIAIFVFILLFSGTAPLFPDAGPSALKKSPMYKAIAVKTLEKIRLPKGYHEGLSLDGTDIWVSNGEKGKVWVVDTASGKVTSTIEPIAGFTESVSRMSAGQFLVTDWDEKKLYKASLNKNRLNPELWVSVRPAHPAGALWTGDRLFVITWTRGMGTRFDLLELDDQLKLSRTISIQSIEEPAHLAWDGKNLWITSWYNPLVYKVDVDKWEILGAFRSPAPMTTGIVWDGKYLWLTGTYSDLYKLEIFQ